MMSAGFSRRSAIVSAAAMVAMPAVFIRPARAADFKFRQFHNQSATSPLHKHLVDMWAAVKAETNGRVETEVFPQNNKIQGSDPAALEMLIAGEIEFFTLMGGILGRAVPVAEVQQVPFSFTSEAQAHAAVDGSLGAYLREEMAAKGIYGFPVMAFDNGMRQVTNSKQPIAKPEDFTGLKIRVPPGQLFADTFKALGAEPITTTSSQIYEALQTVKADGQENPLAIIEVFKLHEVQKYVSMTNHMWAGFNLMAHLPTWKKLPADVAQTIEKNAAKHVQLQREEQIAFNRGLRTALVGRGMVFNDVDQAPFRARLATVYATWKDKLGSKCWGLLEEHVGRLG